MFEKLAQRLGLHTNPTIFFVSAALTVVFVVSAIVFTDVVDAVFGTTSDWILTNLGWLYILGVTTFLIFLIWIAFSRFGTVRLGQPDSRPEYSNPVWFAMLFAAGIGSILMFWGVAEPVSHYAEPPRAGVEPQTIEAAEEAMGFTLYHFGLHTWTIFCLPALAFAYFVYRKGLPFRVSSIFHPFLGEGIHGPLGRAIDVIAVLGTLFGVSVTIGLGTLQINSGLNTLFGVEESRLTQLILIAVVTTIAVVSVASGLDIGIKWLSTINIFMAVALLLFVFLAGSTLFLAKGIIETTGIYLEMLIPLSFWNDTFANTGWQGSWTVFYWAWTITWSPFVGIFIARISKGRTIREFVLGVLAAPTVFSVIWFSVFGLSSFNIERNQGGNLVEEVVTQEDVPGALFAFLEHFPLTIIMSMLSILIVLIFFTTSSDSASLVVDILCSGEAGNPTRQRVFWGVTEGVVAATVLTASGTGGLDALQQTIIVFGLPFFVIGFFMMVGLVRSLQAEFAEGSGVQRERNAPLTTRARRLRRSQKRQGGDVGSRSGERNGGNGNGNGFSKEN
ncbi:multidrug DMT transporter permease [Nocardiopsis sp. TSRI0078]|uniref:BCCT family transporter n=1 Tax=unclassified Nocardiopsis TaxID=2649073 RepID=UPI00093BE990|nr:BCCT family transporter [Nocardiopsis sp. TSRI0078]OKI15302.1 multidrug DMT transporter permease [Nocardiopsis sp. TSRI0078]